MSSSLCTNLWWFVALKLLLPPSTREITRAEPQCRDDNNRTVDWFVLYKLPRIAQSRNPLIREGLSYLYITSDTVDKGWQLSSKDISRKNSTTAYTLRPIYGDEGLATSKMWVLYNDSPPDASTSGKFGHTKGVVLVGRRQGFWLIHSVPNFPPIPEGGETPARRLVNLTNNASVLEGPATGNGISAITTNTKGEYGYPTSGRNYGQSFLCISLGSDQFHGVATQLMYNQIIIYRRNIPASLAQIHPMLADAFNQVRINEAPFSNEVHLRSLGGLQFISFAKTDKWHKDLYDDFVAPQLKTDLLTETWLNGRSRLPSDCGGTKVFNVESIVLPAASVAFTSTHDHSKWAVASTNKSYRNWVCIGDINRAETQYNRGGGTVCLNLTQLWSNYRNAVNDIEPCPRLR